MQRTTLLLILAILLAASVVAQVKPTPPAYDSPPDRAYDPGHCHSLMVKQLYAATDPSDPLQEGYLRAAEAYQRLDEANQPC